jgi:hypothetical protein
MSAGVALLILGGGLALLGAFVLLAVCAKLAGPDTDQRDPYQLADRPSDAPAVDLDLALARDTGVDVTPDGTHENRSDVDDQRWTAELLWLHAQMPEAALLDLEPDAQGDVLPPPVVPGWSWRRTDDGWASGA